MSVSGLRIPILTAERTPETAAEAQGAHRPRGALKTFVHAFSETKESQLRLRMGGGSDYFHRDGGFPGPSVVERLLQPPKQQHSGSASGQPMANFAMVFSRSLSCLY
eukprot:jgi/Undpi1/2327/HiC_scaffold_13.g05710.m1